MIETPANCLHCGVCCFSKSATYVRVSGDDWNRFGARAEELAHFIGQRAYMRMRDGHCLALEISQPRPGNRSAEPVFFCTVYDQRPQICRDLERGSMQCAGELATKADRVSRR